MVQRTGPSFRLVTNCSHGGLSKVNVNDKMSEPQHLWLTDKTVTPGAWLLLTQQTMKCYSRLEKYITGYRQEKLWSSGETLTYFCMHSLLKLM